MESLLKRRVAERLETLGKNPFEAARDAGLSREFINDILIDKKATVRGDGLSKLAIALEVPVEYLILEDFELKGADGTKLRKPRDDEKVSVKQIDLRFGMGGGAFYDSEVEAKPMTFSRSWLRQITGSPVESLFWASGIGDSMFPTIGDGDLILIDTSQKSPTMADKIWALTQYGQGKVKRLRATADGYLIMSDNPLVPSETASDGSMEIVGRVVASVRRL